MTMTTDWLREQLDDLEEKIAPKRATKFILRVLTPIEQLLAGGDEPAEEEFDESFTLSIDDDPFDRIEKLLAAEPPPQVEPGTTAINVHLVEPSPAEDDNDPAPARAHTPRKSGDKSGRTAEKVSGKVSDSEELSLHRRPTPPAYPSKHPRGAALKRGHHYSLVGGRFIDWGPDKSPAYGAFVGDRRGIAEDWGEPLE